MILHSFYSDDHLREAQVIRTDFFGEAFKVLCVTYKEPTPKTYKQYVERIQLQLPKRLPVNKTLKTLLRIGC